MKKVILILTTIFQLISCREPFTRFNDEVEYNEFKENWVEPENYSFEWSYSIGPECYDLNLENPFNGYYRIKVEKINSETKFYLSSYYFDYYQQEKENFNREISKDDLINYIGKENFIQSVSDCITKFDDYRLTVPQSDADKIHLIDFLSFRATSFSGADYHFSVVTFKNDLWYFKNPDSLQYGLVIWIENYQVL